jgi:hypothetical protein
MSIQPAGQDAPTPTLSIEECQDCGGVLDTEWSHGHGADGQVSTILFDCQRCDAEGSVSIRDGRAGHLVGPAVDPTYREGWR